MDLGSVFLILALLLMVGLYVSRPLLERKLALPATESSAKEHVRSALMAERDRVLNALQELDFDYALGKIPEEDYPLQRAGLLKQGANILRQLDEIQHVTPEVDADQRLEAAIAARRLAGAPVSEKEKPAGDIAAAPAEATAKALDDDLEILLANRRRARQDKAVGFCPKCGKPLQKSDRFCPKCGAKLV